MSQGTRGPKNNPCFLGQPGQLHSPFKAAHACTDLLCSSCVVYSHTCTFIVAICGPLPPPKKTFISGLLDSYIQNSKLDTICLDPKTKIRQIHGFSTLFRICFPVFFFLISRVPGQLNDSKMHTHYFALPFPYNKKIGKSFFARVCSPEIVPLYPGSMNSYILYIHSNTTHIFSLVWN